MHRGYIRLWRKVMDRDSLLWQTRLPVFKCALTCLLMANYKPGRVLMRTGGVINVEPGQFVTSLKNLATAANISLQATRTSLETLSSTEVEFLTRKTTCGVSIISIVNWESYQSDTIDNNTTINSASTRHQHAINTPSTQTKEGIRKDKKGKNKIIHDHAPKFDEFWIIYPRKVNKPGAFKKWAATLESESTDPDQLITAAANYAAKVKGKDEKYILHPATFLGPDRRWMDYLESATAAGGQDEVDYDAAGAYRREDHDEPMP